MVPFCFSRTCSLLREADVVSGKNHERQRKILGPAFFASQMKAFLPIFQEAASKVSTHLAFSAP